MNIVDLLCIRETTDIFNAIKVGIDLVVTKMLF